MQDIDAANARAFENSYSREVQGQQEAQQQRATLERTVAIQREVDERAAELEKFKLQQSAAQHLNDANRIEKQTARQYTLADIAQARKSWGDQVSMAKHQLQHIQDNPEKYDPSWAQGYSKNMYTALSHDEQRFETGVDSFLHNAKEGDSITRHIDFGSFESPKLFEATQTNPLVIQAAQAKIANTQSQTTTRNTLLPLRALKLEQAVKNGAIGTTEKHIIDAATGFEAKLGELQSEYQDRVRKDGKSDDADILYGESITRAKSGLAASRAQLQAAMQQGRIPQDFLTGPTDTSDDASSDSTTPTDPTTQAATTQAPATGMPRIW